MIIYIDARRYIRTAERSLRHLSRMKLASQGAMQCPYVRTRDSTHTCERRASAPPRDLSPTGRVGARQCSQLSRGRSPRRSSARVASAGVVGDAHRLRELKHTYSSRHNHPSGRGWRYLFLGVVAPGFRKQVKGHLSKVLIQVSKRYKSEC